MHSGGMPTGPDPGLDLAARRWLRLRVGQLRAATQSRTFPTAVEVVGGPGWTDLGAPSADHGLRVDLLCRLLAGHGGAATVAVIRPGPHERRDEDMAWARAALVAADVVGVSLTTVVIVSRWGWLDLASGEQRTWKRLRVRAYGART